MKCVNESVRAILATGFAREGTAAEALREGIAGFIQKPFRIDELSEILSLALSDASSAGNP